MDNGSTSANSRRNVPSTAFRDAFKGYNKDDVNAYIEECNLHFASVESDYKKIIYAQKQEMEGMAFKIEDYDHMRAELAQLNSKLAESSGENDETKEKFEKYEKLLTTLNERVEQLEKENSELKDELNTENAENSSLIDENADLQNIKAAMTQTISEQREKIEELTEHINELPAAPIVMDISTHEDEVSNAPAVQATVTDEELQQKAKMYDDMSRQLGNLMIIASSNADKIISDANEKAATITSSANAEAADKMKTAEDDVERFRLEGKAKVERMISTANSKLFGMSDEYIRSYTKYMEQIQQEFKGIIDTMSEKSNEVRTVVANMRETVGKELDLEFARIACEKNNDEANTEDTVNVTVSDESDN